VTAPVLSVEQADALAARIREEIAKSLDFESVLCGWCEKDSRAADLRNLDRWLLVLHHAHDGLREHHAVEQRYALTEDADVVCACCWQNVENDPCPDARRYTDLAQTASDALTGLSGLYGVDPTFGPSQPRG
jgi:uncharacterized CHY-type Zn-finger protein